jgi:hypothetical protein
MEMSKSDTSKVLILAAILAMIAAIPIYGFLPVQAQEADEPHGNNNQEGTDEVDGDNNQEGTDEVDGDNNNNDGEN